MTGAPWPVSRDLTSTYLKFRPQRQHSRGRGLPGEAAQTRLLSGDGDARGTSSGEVVVEMSSLPPQWIDSADEARQHIKSIRERMVQLTKAQKKRLLKVFGDDGAPDKEVEAISSKITTLVHQCEQQIHQVKSRGAHAAAAAPQDRDLRQNVQRNLATQLQQLSQQFRQSQKDYLSEIKARQGGGSRWDDGPGGGGGAVPPADAGVFSDAQLLELEGMEAQASQRSEEICNITSSITDLHTIFKELAVLVIDQGSILDRIDYNIEQVVVQSKEANVQLQKAEQGQKSNRAMKCILLLVLVNVVLIIVLIVKARH
mmetsp:Transcript_78913/g.223323  ORF Transcript_78913/g.223323 Transcript_78913/m.223323 type:complete len:314 (-) Transcript_78913:120-1061(-)